MAWKWTALTLGLVALLVVLDRAVPDLEWVFVSRSTSFITLTVALLAAFVVLGFGSPRTESTCYSENGSPRVFGPGCLHTYSFPERVWHTLSGS